MRTGNVLLAAAAALLLVAVAWAVVAEPRSPARESSATERPGREPGYPLPFLAPHKPVRFLAWGDAGHGNAHQHAVADAATRVCEADGCDFALQLGDNVYPDGVRNETDPQFESKFERPYANLSLPFYGALGNHDVAMGRIGAAKRDNGDFQVRYALREDRSSDKWRMPGRYYDFREGDVQVVVLDLTLLAHEGAHPAGESAQVAWLETVWDEDAKWRVAVSHFPYLSNGKHGDAGRYDGVPGRGEAVRALLEKHVCGKADLYLAGHDHVLEWLKAPPSCPGTELVVSGAASEAKPLRKEGNASAWFSLGGVHGFFWFEAEEETLVGRAYDAEGAVLFERTLRK